MRRWLAFFIVLTITPCAAEIVETVAHLVSDGDYVHAENARHETSRDAEHGCTPLSHHCGCHSTSLSTVVTVTDLQIVPPNRPTASATDTRQLRGRGNEPPVLPPPIA